MFDLYEKGYIKSVKHEKTDEGIVNRGMQKIAKMAIIRTMLQNWEDFSLDPETEEGIANALKKNGMKYSSLKEITNNSDRKKAAEIVADVMVNALKDRW